MRWPDVERPFTCSRRSFGRALLQELAVMVDAFQGKQIFRLSDLENWPDEELALLKPVIRPDCQILVERNLVCVRKRGTDRLQELFPQDQPNLIVFNGFNGRRSLAEIGRQLSREMDWEEARAFDYAKELFLHLVRQLVCIPANAPEIRDA